MKHPDRSLLRSAASVVARRGRALGSLLLMAGVMSTTCAGRTNEPVREARWCAHRYTLEDSGIAVCATLPLERTSLLRLERQYREVTGLYPRFAEACGVPFDAAALVPPTLHVLRYDELNDRAAFPRKASVGNIVGRYYVGRSSVFVTERALVERGGIHLPHELAHWIHDMNGMKDADHDERLARAFHRFYKQRALQTAAPVVERDRAGALPPSLVSLPATQRGPAPRDRPVRNGAEERGPAPSYDELCGS